MRAPSTTIVPCSGWGRVIQWPRWASCGSARHSPEFCTAWAGTPAAITAAIASSAERARSTPRRAGRARAARPSRSAVARPARSARPSSSASARQSASSRQATATHRSSPAHGYTPCGAICGSALPIRVRSRPLTDWSSSAGERKCAHASAWAKSRYWPSPVRPPVVERGQQGAQREARRRVVAVRAERAARRAVGPAGEVEEPGERRGHRAEAGVALERPGLAEQAARQHDQARVAAPAGPRTRGRATARPRGENDSIDHVGPAHEVVEHRAACARCAGRR